MYGRLNLNLAVIASAACSCYGIAGRIHTSACTVAVMPELPYAELRHQPSRLRIDTFRSVRGGWSAR
ncbi:hypothetical protein ACVXG8_10140 [Escherichia coli]